MIRSYAPVNYRKRLKLGLRLQEYYLNTGPSSHVVPAWLRDRVTAQPPRLAVRQGCWRGIVDDRSRTALHLPFPHLLRSRSLRGALKILRLSHPPALSWPITNNFLLANKSDLLTKRLTSCWSVMPIAEQVIG